MLTADELTAMRATQVAAMQDTCRHYQYVAAQDGYGEPIVTWTAALDYACGFRPNPVTNSLNKDGQMITVRTDAELRLPLAAYGVVQQRDRIQLLTRYSDATYTDADYYEIVGEILPGPTGIVVRLRKVTV
jgi:hypothetical protein